MRAAVEAADDWGTYVCAHVYTPRGIRRCIAAGVKSIEHGQLADEDTVKAMADRGVWWSIQPFLDDEDANRYTDPGAVAKQKQVAEGTVRAFELAERHRVNYAFGTDALFSASGGERQAASLRNSRASCRPSMRFTGRPGPRGGFSRYRASAHPTTDALA